MRTTSRTRKRRAVRLLDATANPIALTSQTAGKYITVVLVNKQTGYVVAGGSTTLVVGT